MHLSFQFLRDACYCDHPLCSTLQGQVKPCLEKLNTDTDVDVRYFASEAICVLP
ncbi:unnamed protein product [Ixodes pacificus]